MSRLRRPLRWTGAALGSLLLIYIAYMAYSFATGEERMTKICGQITPGMTVTELRLFAQKHGLVVPRHDSGHAYLAEHRTMGRCTCRVVLDAGVVKRSEYVFYD